VTPFLFYFCNEVYNRLQVDAVPPKTDLEVYQTALRSVYKELHADHETGAADNK